MITIEFTVEGAPVPKGRARVTTRGGFARAYTPAKTREYEDVVKSAGKEAMNGREPLESPLKLFLLFFMPIPKSASKKAKAEMLSGMMKHTKKPDSTKRRCWYGNHSALITGGKYIGSKWACVKCKEIAK